MSILTLDQIYRWKSLRCKYPWLRKHLEVEYCKYEKKRVEDVKKWWFNSLRKAKYGQSLEEVTYYVSPIKISSFWSAAIAKKGSYNYVGLSALRNDYQMGLIMLVPNDKKLPAPFSLIRILKSKKDFIHNEKNNKVQYTIVAEEFEEVDPIFIYVDVPFEKRRISKFIQENMISDSILAKSFQPTISGAPFGINNLGGISHSTFLKNSQFSQEFNRTLKLMQPYELSGIMNEFPENLRKGKQVSMPNIKGIKFHIAEQSSFGKNRFSAFSTSTYGSLNRELDIRKRYLGEYSIVCSLNHRGQDYDMIRGLLSKFVATEITQPFNGDQLLRNYDVDLQRAQRNIDEDLWLQVAAQKENNPNLPENDVDIERFRHHTHEKWGEAFESLGLKKNMEHAIQVQTNKSFINLQKIAQSIARDYNQEQVDESLMKQSMKIFTENIDGLTNNPIMRNQIDYIIPQKLKDKKYNAVISELSNPEGMDVNELFGRVKDDFKDIYELQEFIDKLSLNGEIFEPIRGIYKSI